MFRHLAAPAVLASYLWLSIPLSAVTYPALPTTTVDVTCCPAATRTVAVHSAQALQAAFDNAALGDEIVLDAGTTYKGNFIVKMPSGTSGWVIVRSSASASLPPPGTRVGSSDAANMAKIMSPNYGDPGTPVYPALSNYGDTTPVTDMGVHHYRFIGIEFATGLTSYNYHVIDITPPVKGVPYSTATMPHDIIIDRSLIHGNDPIATAFPNGAALLNGSARFDVANGAIVDSAIYNVWGIGTETQALTCGGGPGPRLIQNNEISGGTESFMCGGGLLPYSDRLPSDITIVHNYFNHPASWQTSTPIVPFVKNLFELKVGKRVRITDNVFENNWDRGGGQRGFAMTITPRPVQDSNYGAVPAILSINEVSDVLIANNVVRKVGGFISTALVDVDCATYSLTCVNSARQLISDNMADYDTAYASAAFAGVSAIYMQDFSAKRNTLLGHNTGGGAAPAAFYGNRYTCQGSFGMNFEWSNNINLNGTQGDCTYDPANILISSWLGTVSVTSNLVANVTGGALNAWSTFGHGSQMATTESDLKLNADKLTLQTSSPYFGMGIGANLSCFNEAAIRAGTPSVLCPLPPEVLGSGLPIVTIASPTAGPTFNTSSSTINLSGTAADVSGITQVTWMTDHGTSGTATGASNWSIAGLTLPTGATRVTVTARSATGSQGSASLAVTNTPDPTPPVIAITSPTSSGSLSTSSGSVDLGGTASDNVGVTQVTWTTDKGGSGTATGTSNWAITGVPVSGSTQITVTAHDAAGNVSSALLTVTSSFPVVSDTTPPTIVITSPTSGSSFTASGSSINISGTAADNAAVSQVTWSTDKGASGIALGTTNWTTVTASDPSGNVASRFLTVTYSAPDTTPPTISIIAPSTGTTFSTTGTSVTLNGIGADNVGITQVAWVTDHGASGVANGTTSWSTGVIPLPAGSTQITVTASDKAGNKAQRVLAVTTPPQPDTAAQTINITSPTSAGTFSTTGTAISLSGTATDNVGVTQVTWVASGGGSGIAAGTSSWNASGIVLQSGSNQLTVTARDAAGNQSSAVITVTSTALSPGKPSSVIITSPTTSPVYTTSVGTVALAGTASASAGVIQVTWSADRGDGSGVATGTTSWVVNQVNLKNGTNTITVTAHDSANNLSSQLIQVVYSPPSVKTKNLPRAQAGQQYTYSLAVDGGVPPYSWSASSLPAGLSLSSDGLITGKPTATGTYDVDVVVHDSAVSDSAVLTLSVDPWVDFVSTATFTPAWAAPQSMLTALGWQLSTGTTAAAAGPLPTMLSDTTVTVRDAEGKNRLAPLYFVSPDQINFVVPAETATGPATVTVANLGRSIASATIYVASIAPSVFEANADGLAAANLLRVRGDVSEYDPISQRDPSTNQVVAIPIDLSPDTDSFFLILYGTGVRFRSSLDAVSATVGGLDAQVVYAGSAGASEGLDLVSIKLPTQVHGWTDIVTTVDGVAANTVRVLIK
jgi:uncharacterized protein (TIGR03437 family)